MDLQQLDAFIAAARERGVTKVALRVVAETRPIRGAGTSIVVGPQRWVDVTAYHQGVVLFVRVPEQSGDEVEAELQRVGFDVRSTTDNIT